MFAGLLVYALFVLANLDNRADVSLLFTTITGVPVFVSGLIAFVFGGLVVLPFTVGRKWWRKLAHKERARRKNGRTALAKKSESGVPAASSPELPGTNSDGPDDDAVALLKPPSGDAKTRRRRAKKTPQS